MRKLLVAFVISLTTLACIPVDAGAAFGIKTFDITFTDEKGEPAEAGTHPFASTISFGTNFDNATLIPEGWIRDFTSGQIPGLVGDTTAYEPCTAAQFFEKFGESLDPNCALSTQVGIVGVSLKGANGVAWETAPIFNVTPPPGVLLRLGFTVLTQNVFVDVKLNDAPPYNGIGASRNIVQAFPVFGAKVQLWGNPSDPAHNELRRGCAKSGTSSVPPGDIAAFEFEGTGKSCPVSANPRPFLTMPTDCSAPLVTSFEAVSWNDLDQDGQPDTDAGSILTHDVFGNPAPLNGCGKLRPLFHPTISARPTSRAAHSPTGLDFSLQVDDEGLTSVEGLRHPDIAKGVVTLPKGMTANPSVAEGLEVCSEADLARERLASLPGVGCPEASKIGTMEVESPLVDEAVKGALYQAAPHANLADDALIAFYMVFKSTNLGVIIKQPVKVEPDPETGQLKAIAEDIPRLPFARFNLHFREGGRSPLITPPLCGTYEATAELTSRSGGPSVTATDAFQVISGPNESPCPPGGTPPFGPGFRAGSISNHAGAYSPFYMRLTRRDGDQDLTRFDATLPRGVVAKLAGVAKCPDAQIALARTKTGKAELASPSCPADSKIGTVTGGAGVGSQLTYVPGSIYLSGPFGGAPLSAVAIVPAVAGPFDVGTIVYRQALKVNPRTGIVTADGAASDPLPHILAGVPIPVRDVQVHVDRSNFMLNPTSCNPFATKASIWGGGNDAFSIADNSPVARESRYQAASCASLGFKPKLELRLKGPIKRGGHPKFRATYKPRQGDANLEGLVLRFPRSAFLDQAHIRTICTRVQYAAKSCPPGSVYGHVRAFTPLLSDPLEGPVYLRSSDHNLPDIVLALKGLVDVEAVVRVDSKKGGIRTTLTEAPDVPITKVVVTMQGGEKGLIVNSTDLCAQKRRANLRLDGHNGKVSKVRPVVGAGCGKSSSS